MISAALFCKASSAVRTRWRSSMAICNSPTRSGIDIILNVADGCARLGLARGDRLLVVLQNRWEMATLHWACQFAGIVIVPLNWRAKPDELDYCVTDAGVKAIVYEPVCADAVSAKPRGARRAAHRARTMHRGRTTTFDALLRRTRACRRDMTHAKRRRSFADPLHLGHDGQGERRAAPSPARARRQRSRTSRRTCIGTANARSA